MDALLGIAIIVAGGILVLLYRRWAAAEADARKKMSDRESKKKHEADRLAGRDGGASGSRRTFGRR